MSKNQPSIPKNPTSISLAEQLHQPFMRQEEIGQSLSIVQANEASKGPLTRHAKTWAQAGSTLISSTGLASQV